MTRTAVFRVASGPAVGAGHLVRCASLACELQALGFEIAFVTDTELGDTRRLLGDCAFSYYQADRHEDDWRGTDDRLPPAIDALPTVGTVDWLVVDHYALDATWLEENRHASRHLAVIDDIANRRLVGDLLVNQNYGACEQAYQGLAPSSMTVLTGPSYVLLGRQYKRARDAIEHRRAVTNGRSVLVSFGLSDLEDITSLVLHDIEHIIPTFTRLDVVIGSEHPGFEYIHALCASHPNAFLHVETRSMADLLFDADLAIGGVGSSTWERMCLGVPILSVAHIPHELSLGKVLKRDGYIDLLVAATSERGDIAQNVERLLTDSKRRRSLIERGMELVDGRGAQRVASILNGYPGDHGSS